VIQPKKKKKSMFGKVIAGIFLLIGLWLIIVFAFPFFEHWVYLKFFLICAMGFAFLGITYLLRT
jgi:fatty acid desaturase